LPKPMYPLSVRAFKRKKTARDPASSQEFGGQKKWLTESVSHCFNGRPGRFPTADLYRVKVSRYVPSPFYSLLNHGNAFVFRVKGEKVFSFLFPFFPCVHYTKTIQSFTNIEFDRWEAAASLFRPKILGKMFFLRTGRHHEHSISYQSEVTPEQRGHLLPVSGRNFPLHVSGRSRSSSAWLRKNKFSLIMCTGAEKDSIIIVS
jgi:hypothetical protein